jgi:acyl-CoA reductase-like NAD-dependent aldehyde dehydrogenase
VGEVTVSSPQEIAEKVAKAHAVKKHWKMLGARKRAEMLRPLLGMLEQRSTEIAKVTSQEMGKPISQSLESLLSDANYLRAFLDQGPEYLANEITVNEKSAENSVLHQIVYEPIGVVACIVPWNYPFSNFLWGVIPNLIAGNPVVFKHSEECPLIGKIAEEMMQALKLPEGVFAEVYGDASVGKALVEQDVDLIWFTGSSSAGKNLFEVAAKKQIKSVLEMGGSDPVIVFEDAKKLDIDRVISKIYARRFDNCGQICCALKRLIVHESLFQEVVDKLLKQLETIKVGDPLDPQTQMGPLAAERQVVLLESQMADAVKLGAKVLCGGKRPDGLSGAYYLPTILTNIDKNMRIWKEETFGPVLPIVTFKTEEEAIALANDTIYGLSAVVYSADKERARRVAAQIDAGCIDINFGSHWRPCNPFGGYKASGVGREHGRYGFQELCQVKVIAE